MSNHVRSQLPAISAQERQTCLAMLYESVGILSAMADRLGLDLSVVIEPKACHDFEQERFTAEASPVSSSIDYELGVTV